MRTENLKDCYTFFGEYLGDFSSEPDAQVQSIVFVRPGVLHVYYRLKEGFTLGPSISDKWLPEIKDYASEKGISWRYVYLHHEQ